MTRSFQRKVQVTISSGVSSGFKSDKVFNVFARQAVIENLRVSFEVVKSLSREPNTATVMIYNLAEGTRREFADKHAHLVLAAGYEGSPLAELYRGDITDAKSYRNGPDWVTEISCGTGAKATRNARSSISLRKGGSNKDFITGLLKDAGLKMPANVDEFKSFFTGKSSENGKSVHGPTLENLHKSLRKGGINMSIQDDTVIMIKEGGVRYGQAAVISEKTGMVGSPELGSPEKKKKKPVLSAKTLLRPDLKAGALLKVESRSINGSYKMLKVSHTGDTHGNPWYSDVEAVAI